MRRLLMWVAAFALALLGSPSQAKSLNGAVNSTGGKIKGGVVKGGVKVKGGAIKGKGKVKKVFH
jgi:hypothetical protein